MTEIVCARCGHRNPEDANFCSSCGMAIDSVPEDRPTITFHLDGAMEDEINVDLDDVPAGGMLLVRAGPNAGSKFAVDKDVLTLGRHPESDVFLDDITVSRRHVEVVHIDNTYTVRDVGSLNGTYVNRQRIEEAPLENGDELQVGKFKLVFLTGADLDVIDE
jgi:hypothetical protein